MQPIFRNLLLLLALIASSDLWGQHQVLRNYTVDDGLPSSEIYHVMQDSKGYIWMATNFGVSRFDGNTFRNMDMQDGLPENTIFEIYEDKTGRIWFISFPFQLSYFLNDSIHPYKYNGILEKIAGHGLVPTKKSFNVEVNDNIWFGFLSDDRIFNIDSDGNLTINEDVKDSPYSISISEINGQLFAAQGKERGTYKRILSLKSARGNRIAELGLSSSKYKGGYFLMLMSVTGDLYYAHNELLFIIKPDGSSKTFNLKDRILWLGAEKNGSIWIGKEFSGASRYSPSHFMDGPTDSLLDGISVSSVMIDNEGGAWFSSLGSGVYYLSSEAFISYTELDGLTGKNIKAVEVFKDKIFLGSEDNFKLDIIENGKVRSVSDFGHEFNKTRVLTAFDNKVLWIGTEAFLHSYDNRSYAKIINNHPKVINKLGQRKFVLSIKDIYPLSSDEVMLAQMQSLSIVRNGKVVYDSYLDDKISLRIEAIERESDSTFLLGTFNGLWRYNGSTFQFLGKDSELLRQRITDVKVCQNGKGYILGTKGFGLIIKYNGSLIQLTEADGLSSNSVTSLLLTNDELWAGTNSGLNVFSIEECAFGKPEIKIFRKEHGLVSNEINQIKGDSRYIYIATNRGLTILDKAKYKPLLNPPPVYIHGLSIMKRDTILVDNYNLNHDQNFITISYAGITFRDAGNLVYKYRLVGLSNKWIFTNDFQVVYAFLPHGKYRFEVYAINSEGLESTEPATLNFIIHPPFWKTWWFISLLLVLAILAIIGFIKYRTSQFKKQHVLQSDINRYRQQALIRQMDPHFVFNTLNSIQSFIIKNDNLASTQYLSKFSRLMRLILNNSQKQEVRLSDEIDALNLYMELESMRFKHKFEYSINVDHYIDADLCYIPAFIVQPFIENSIWHGIMNLDGPGLIKVNFMADGDQILCTIEDNGIGRVRSQEIKKDTRGSIKSSMGISIIEARLGLLSSFYGVRLEVIFSDILSVQNEVIGTRVNINLPIIS